MSDNSNCFDCPFCEYHFDRKWEFQNHLNRVNKCYEDSTDNNEMLEAIKVKYGLVFNEHPTCLYCNKSFSKKGSLDRHLKAICPKDPELANKLRDQVQTSDQTHGEDPGRNILPTQSKDQKPNQENDLLTHNKILIDSEIITKSDMVQMLNSLFSGFKEDIMRSILNQNLSQTSNNNNNSLQVMSIDGDLLALLSDHLGNLDKARLRIANCAMGTIESDCRLIEDMYHLNETGDSSDGGPALRFADSKRTKVECFDKNGKRIIKTKAQLGDSLAVQIINAYSITLQYFDDYHNKHKRYPLKNMDNSQIQDWNEHMGKLSDLKYRKGLVNRLKIPDKELFLPG